MGGVRRRQFLITAGALLASRVARAQQPGKLYRIGHLGNQPASASPDNARINAAYVGRLAEHGFVEGKNLVLERRFALGDPTRYAGFAAELVRLKVDLITTSGGGAGVRAAMEATATIPIVFIGVSDVVRAGLVASLARPGGNVTGVASFGTDLVPKQLELLKELLPQAARVAFLFAPFYGSAGEHLRQEREAAAKALGLTLIFLGSANPEELTATLAAVARERPDAVFAGPNPLMFARRDEIAQFALQHRLPLVADSAEGVRAGGLMSYGTDNAATFRRAADYVARILRGANPAELPVEQPTKVELVINVKTARALGLTIPQSLLSRADTLIE